jgi:hypothetical protein
MVRHDQRGALGIALNRPMEERSLAALLEATGEKDTSVTGSVRGSRFEHIAASINLVLRSALILRRACPTWGARLEGLRASRRTATSEIERAAILRDGRMQTCALLRMRPSRRAHRKSAAADLRT